VERVLLLRFSPDLRGSFVSVWMFCVSVPPVLGYGEAPYSWYFFRLQACSCCFSLILTKSLFSHDSKEKYYNMTYGNNLYVKMEYNWLIINIREVITSIYVASEGNS
jgi:hypothetical protein